MDSARYDRSRVRRRHVLHARGMLRGLPRSARLEFASNADQSRNGTYARSESRP